MIEGDLAYIRIVILRNGIKIGDVGLAFRNGGWIIARSSYINLFIHILQILGGQGNNNNS
jgi:hypothetical protein